MFAVRYIPPWFPFAEFQRSARTLKEEFDDMRELPFEYAVRRAVSVGFVYGGTPLSDNSMLVIGVRPGRRKLCSSLAVEEISISGADSICKRVSFNIFHSWLRDCTCFPSHVSE